MLFRSFYVGLTLPMVFMKSLLLVVLTLVFLAVVSANRDTHVYHLDCTLMVKILFGPSAMMRCVRCSLGHVIRQQTVAKDSNAS